MSAPGGAPGGAAPAGGSIPAGVPTSAPAEVKPVPKPGAPKPPEKKDGDKPKKPAEKGTEAPPEWSDKDDAELFERLQKAPWAKVKANGEERRIASKEDFLALATDASRSRGLNKVVEQTKKEQAEAKAAREEAQALKVALDRARRGDASALRELGLVPDNERAELQKQWEALPPEVQETYRRNYELEQELAQRRAQEAAAKQEEATKAKKLKQEQVLGQARAHLKEILSDVQDELHDVELPEIIGAMRTLLETGQRIGKDYDVSMLKAFVTKRREATLHSRFSALKPDAAIKLALPHLKALVGTPEGLEQLENALGVDFDAVWRPINERRLAKWKASKTKEALKPAPKTESREEREERTPLSPFRYRG